MSDLAHQHAHHGHGGGGPLKTSAQATLHCLTGCVIGEVAGLLIGVSLGFEPWQTIVLATALAYAAGMTLGLLPVMKNRGVGIIQAFRIIWLGEVISIGVMELVMNTVDYQMGGMTAPSVMSWMFWRGIAFAVPGRLPRRLAGQLLAAEAGVEGMPLGPVIASGPLARRLLLAASALALAVSPATAMAQHAQHPGMKMPEKKPAKKKPVAKKQAAKKAAAAKSRRARRRRRLRPKRAAPDPAKPPIPPPVDHPVDHGAMGHAPVAPPAPAEAPAPPPVDHSQMAHPPAAAEHAGHAMTGALGPYPMERESSGTAWQPDRSEHMGVMRTSGDWTLMGHGVLNLVYDHQSGPRGDDKAFASGMVMGMARRPIGNGTLQFKASLSPDPLMGKRGYPLLLASGETADGEEHLVDRQHPHDFFMELSASVSQNIGPKSSVFLYGGLPGEPAFGPPAFMHREAIMDSPEAPISHHWLDSTHISFGVVTAGIVLDRVKIEASRFNGREPDQHRWNIETAPLDSTAVRLSWNPTAELSLQGSWGKFKEPEQLEPGVDQTRWSASALYADEIAPGWKLAGDPVVGPQVDRA